MQVATSGLPVQCPARRKQSFQMRRCRHRVRVVVAAATRLRAVAAVPVAADVAGERQLSGRRLIHLEMVACDAVLFERHTLLLM